jgi:hypothetical protein
MKRPFGVTVIGILLLAQGLYLVVLPLAAVFLKALPGADSFRPPLVFDFAGLSTSAGFSAIFIGALGVFILASGIGVLRLHPFSWLAAMALQGWTLLAFLLGGVSRGGSSYPAVLLSLVIVFYLNSRSVRRTFDLVRDREASATAGGPAVPRAGTAAEPEAMSRGSESS